VSDPRFIFDDVLARPLVEQPTKDMMRDVAKVAVKFYGPLIDEDNLTALLIEVYEAGYARGAHQPQREMFNQPKRRKK